MDEQDKRFLTWAFGVAGAVLVGGMVIVGTFFDGATNNKAETPATTARRAATTSRATASVPRSTSTTAIAGHRWTEDDLEYKLAVLDHGYISTTDPRIDDYWAGLGVLSVRCTNTKEQLGDFAARTKEVVAERTGRTLKIADVLGSWLAVFDDAAHDCQPDAARWLADEVNGLH